MYLNLFRRKTSVKIQELEDLLEQQRARAANLEKTKNRLTAELREVTIELENVSTCTLMKSTCALFLILYGVFNSLLRAAFLLV